MKKKLCVDICASVILEIILYRVKNDKKKKT